MSRLVWISMGVVFVLTTTTSYAQERAPLGVGHISLKLDYLVFTSDHFDKGGNQDDGLYIGLEGYGEISPNIYLGGEIGQGVNVDVLGEDITFVPIEVNAKYAFEVAPGLVLDVGAGIATVYVEIRDEGPFGSGNTEDDWLVGGQFFGDLTYKINWFSFGANLKYQLTQDFADEDFNINNLRVGAQIGVAF